MCMWCSTSVLPTMKVAFSKSPQTSNCLPIAPPPPPSRAADKLGGCGGNLKMATEFSRCPHITPATPQTGLHLQTPRRPSLSPRCPAGLIDLRSLVVSPYLGTSQLSVKLIGSWVMGASFPPSSIADTPWEGMHTHALSPCLLAGAELTSLLSRLSPTARRTHSPALVPLRPSY